MIFISKINVNLWHAIVKKINQANNLLLNVLWLRLFPQQEMVRGEEELLEEN